MYVEQEKPLIPIVRLAKTSKTLDTIVKPLKKSNCIPNRLNMLIYNFLTRFDNKVYDVTRVALMQQFVHMCT